MTGNKRENWPAGVVAGLIVTGIVGAVWDDWFFGFAIGAMICIVVAFTFSDSPRR